MTNYHRGVVWEVEEHRGSFALVFVAIFLLTFSFLAIVGATPDPSTQAPAATPEATPAVATKSTTPELPTRVVATSINLDVSVSDPTTTDVDALDQLLLKGAVRYPTSAMLGVNGTVLIFGHSSYLPIVANKAYKTFDGIQNLKPGDIVSVYSDDMEYRYSVIGVKIEDADNDVIDMPSDAQYLTLVTCDSFATKTTRFVMTASLVGTYSHQN